MVPKNVITWVLEILQIFRTASPFSRVQINSETGTGIHFVKPLRAILLCYLKVFHLMASPTGILYNYFYKLSLNNSFKRADNTPGKHLAPDN